MAACSTLEEGQKEDSLGEIDHIAVGAADSHGGMRSQRSYLIQVRLIKKNRTGIRLIRSQNDCEKEEAQG